MVSFTILPEKPERRGKHGNSYKMLPVYSHSTALSNFFKATAFRQRLEVSRVLHLFWLSELWHAVIRHSCPLELSVKPISVRKTLHVPLQVSGTTFYLFLTHSNDFFLPGSLGETTSRNKGN